VATEWLDDAFGPDEVRVSLCIESSVERWVRTWGDFSVSPAWASRVRNRLKKSVPAAAESPALQDGWVVVVEADTGQLVRLTCSSRKEALDLARSTAADVHKRGVIALDDLAG
jgi:hypothetical protein